MERRGMQNSNLNYTSNQMGGLSAQETLLPVVKLPLAPIVSTPPDRRGGNNGSSTATVSTRRGSSIFSPTTQTLDHLNIPPPPQKAPNPDPDPLQLPSAPSNLKIPLLDQNQNSPSTTTTPTPTPQTSTSTGIRYRECLKNHAASMGGHVVDGCGEFMPNGDDGTPEALRCAACDCHRNFHRKEMEDHNNDGNTTTTTTSNQVAAAAATPYHQHSQHQQFNTGKHGRSSLYPQMVNFGGGGGGAESSSEDLNVYNQTSGSKKRFRTKFSQEQKDKMNDFADTLGWRMQKQNEGEVQQFCSEVGVKRQVFKVWMHNNKQAMKKRQTDN